MNSFVKLPNGHSILVKKKDCIQLFQLLTLTNFLFVLQFSFNLIFISALTQINHYLVNFLSTLFYLGLLLGQSD